MPELWQEAFIKGKTGIYLSDVFRSGSHAGQFSVYITGPVHSFDGKFVGVIALEIDMASIFMLVKDATGMGETGETLIARKEGEAALFLNPLRHDEKAALQRKVVFGQRQALPIQEALKGNAGKGIALDYRGKKVVAVWQRMPVLNWGIVAKIDASEAFEPATTLRNFVLVLVVAVITLGVLLAFLVARSISDPIQVLHKGAEEIGSGNLDFRIRTQAKDEIGQLSRAFDDMMDNLQKSTTSIDSLNREITERKQVEYFIKERMKELNLLYGVSGIVETTGISIDD